MGEGQHSRCQMRMGQQGRCLGLGPLGTLSSRAESLWRLCGPGKGAGWRSWLSRSKVRPDPGGQGEGLVIGSVCWALNAEPEKLGDVVAGTVATSPPH